MPTIKLTEKAVTKLAAPAPSGKQTLYWDTDLKGFGVLVSGISAAKTYIVERRLPDGRKRRVTVEATNALSLEAAKSEAEQILHDLRRGNDPKAAKRKEITLRQALHDYVAARKTLSGKSKSGYIRLIETHLADWLDRPLRDVTADMVERQHIAIQQKISQQAKIRNNRGQNTSASQSGSPSGGATIKYTGHASANGVMVALRIIWNFASDRDPDFPANNPVRRLRKSWFQVSRRERRVSADCLPIFYRAVQQLTNPVARDYITLLLFTGMRRAEAGSLRWSDIDFAARVIRLRADETKSKRKLDLPMSDYVFELLAVRREAVKFGEYVFPSNSQSGHIEEPKFAFSEVAAQTGLRLSPHDLRRTFLDVAESTEISTYALKALVNHAAGSDVTAGYLGLTVERLREPTQRIADRMKVLCEISKPIDRFSWGPNDVVFLNSDHGRPMWATGQSRENS